MNDLEDLNDICIPRCLFNYPSSCLKSAELHGFSDASEDAYAAAVYLRSVYDDDRVDVNLIAARTRVAPMKKQSIPRLELLGATILARLTQSIQEVFTRAQALGPWHES